MKFYKPNQLNLTKSINTLENDESISYICNALGFPDSIGKLKGNQVYNPELSRSCKLHHHCPFMATVLIIQNGKAGQEGSKSEDLPEHIFIHSFRGLKLECETRPSLFPFQTFHFCMLWC
jgi:hypothetical protein